MKRNNIASAEVIGFIIMLIIAVSTLSVVYVVVLSDTGPEEKIFATIVGHLEGSDMIFENRRGEHLSFNDTVHVTLAGVVSDVRTVGDFAEEILDDKWDIGELIIYPISIPFVNVEATISNLESNSIVFWGTIREGYRVPGDVIHADISLLPRTFNIESMGGWITCLLSLPEPYNAEMIDNSTVCIVNINNIPVSIYAEDEPIMKENKMMVKFDRQIVKGFLSIGDVLIAVHGELYSGEGFEFFDVIRVI
jgi:hypothetical protein